jgi:hypothetical protein
LAAELKKISANAIVNITGRGSSVVEQPIRNRQVVGSTPTLGSNITHVSGRSFIRHFQTWQDKAGNALPISDTDKGFRGATGASVTFTTLANAQGETNPESLKGDTLQANLIMPEPTHFLNPKLGPVAIIRPTCRQNAGAVAAFQCFVADGLFLGHRPLNRQEFVQVLLGLAEEADEARRQI